MKSIRIVSDGTTNGTLVYSASGELLKGIAKVEICEISPHQDLVTAKVTFALVSLDVTAEQVDE